MLSPTRLKNGCGATFVTTKRSPGAPPSGPVSPFPANRIRDPVLTPAGISTSTDSFRAIRPSPPHSRQSVICLPEPPHSEQVIENCSRPLATEVLPAPVQFTQMLSLEPDMRPLPLQAAQGDFRNTLMLVFTPRM